MDILCNSCDTLMPMASAPPTSKPQSSISDTDTHALSCEQMSIPKTTCLSQVMQIYPPTHAEIDAKLSARCLESEALQVSQVLKVAAC